MANYASKDTLIELTDGADALKDISAAVRTINGITIEALTQESNGFGKTWLESLTTGMAKVDPIQIDGFYDDAANTPSTLWARGASRRLRVTYGGGKSTTVPVIMQKFSRNPINGSLTSFSMTLLPSGAPTEV
jgi:hypothetical protein